MLRYRFRDSTGSRVFLTSCRVSVEDRLLFPARKNFLFSLFLFSFDIKKSKTLVILLHLCNKVGHVIVLCLNSLHRGLAYLKKICRRLSSCIRMSVFWIAGRDRIFLVLEPGYTKIMGNQPGLH